MLLKNKTAKLFLALILPAFLVGCTNIGGPSTPTEFYRLVDVTDSKLGESTGLSMPDLQLGIGPITIPGYVDRPQIVTSGLGGRLNVDDFNHWAEPIQENIERIMVANLSSLLSEKQVFHYPANFHPASTSLQISVEIRDMIKTSDGRVLLSASWNVKRMLDNRLLIREAAKYRSGKIVKGFSEYSEVLSSLFGKLSIDIMNSVKSSNK